MEPYYYSKLTKQQQTVCHAMLQGITELADSFLVPKTEGKELADLFFACVWIIRRFSGPAAFIINIIRIPRI